MLQSGEDFIVVSVGACSRFAVPATVDKSFAGPVAASEGAARNASAHGDIRQQERAEKRVAASKNDIAHD